MPPDRNPAAERPLERTAARAAVIEDPQVKKADALDALWRFFSSVKLAVILILLTIVAAFLGALFVQAPGWAQASPQSYASWLERMRPRFGALTDLYSAVGLFNVYGSVWFRGLVSLLIVNTVVCTANRIPGIWRSIFRPKIVMGDNFYLHSAHRDSIPTPASAESLARLLRRQRYQVITRREGEYTYLYADRNGWAKLGTVLTHLSIVLFLIGAVTGAAFGFSDDEVVIGEGSSYTVGRGYPFQVKLNDFTEEWYPEGMPKDYRSDLSILENGQEVLRQTIRVNEPLVYKGVKFSQSFYGVAPAVEIKDSSGRTVFTDIMPLSPSTLKGYEISWVRFPPNTLVAVGRPQNPSGAAAARIEVQVFTGSQVRGQGGLEIGRPQRMGDLEINFLGDREYTGLRVSRDPGTNIIWAASGLMFLGICSSFYLPRRRLWARLGTQGADLAAFSDKAVHIQRELDNLVKALSPQAKGAKKRDKRRTREE